MGSRKNMPSLSPEAAIQSLRRELQTHLMQRDAIRAEVERCRANLEAYRTNYRPQLVAIQVRADMLAAEFKEKYEESTAAYVDGDRELAKELSLEGHALQEECEALNQQARLIRTQLNDLDSLVHQKLREANALRPVIDAVDKKFKAAQQEARRAAQVQTLQHRLANQIVLIGFPKEENEKIRSFLSTFPSGILRKVERIVYQAREMLGERGAPINGRCKPFPGGKYFVEIYRHDARLGDAITYTIAHELGHVAFDILSQAKQKQWSDLYSNTDDSRFISRYAMRNPKEDFCESMMAFHCNSKNLAQIHAQKYAFLEDNLEKMK